MTDSPYFSFDAQTARIRIDDIYGILNARRQHLDRFGFRNGYLGIAVFFYLYGKHTDKEAYLQQASTCFDVACETINSDIRICYPLDFSDLGIVAQYLIRGGVLALKPNEFLEQVDIYLLEKMRYEIKQHNIAGFSTGAIGYGLYFLHRAHYDSGRFTDVLDELVSAISGCALQNNQGYYWDSSELWLNRPVNISLLNGMSSVVLFLARAAEDGLIKKYMLTSLLEGAVRFVYEQFNKIPPGKIRPGFQDGDLGAGYAVLRAGIVFKKSLWYNKGQQILEQCAVACLENNDMAMTAYVQSGASGAALAFDKIHRISDNTLFATAASFCYGRVLESACNPNEADKTNLSFVQGIAGMGACLIKAAGQGRIDFDELVWLL